MKRKMLSQYEWDFVVRRVPMPCVDVIVERESKILMGFRAIAPYRNVWALPGGVIRKNEHPKDTIRRVLGENNVRGTSGEIIGVFPIRFPRHPLKRYDISHCYLSRWVSGEPRPSRELVRLGWFSPEDLPKATGLNYRRMIDQAFKTRQICETKLHKTRPA